MMAVNLKEKRCLVYDNGLFVHTARSLADYFGEVYYYMPWKSAFPKWNQLLVGDGFDELIRVRDFWDVAHEIDLFVFPDIYDGDLQMELVRQGKRVWGGRKGEDLELFRWKTKKLLPQIGLPEPPGALLNGFNDLRSYLKEHDNKWVKISAMRGMQETWHHDTYPLSEPKLDELEHKFGAVKHIAQFIVDDAIDDCVEVGFDGWCVDGQYPPMAGLGYEAKDTGLIMRTLAYEDFPEPVQKVNSALAPYFKEHQFRGWMANEIRWKDGQAFATDPCQRQGTPSSEVLMELFGNWGEILWEGAEGHVVPPQPLAKYGVEVMIHSSFADQDWQAIDFPPSLDRWIKLRNVTKIKDRLYAIPQTVGLPEVGAVVALGNTMEEAISLVKERAEQVKGYFVEVQTKGIPQAIRAILQGQKDGIDFGVEEDSLSEECMTV